MGGGGGQQREQVVSNPGPPQVVPELKPFVTEVGKRATRALGFPEFDLGRFAQDRIFQVPGLSGLEQMARGQIVDRAQNGIPTPEAEAAARQTYGQYAGGNIGDSPAMKNALAGLQSQIMPQVQNQAALSGLAQSGFLPDQTARTYAQQLVPLYSQGMQNQLTGAQGLQQIGQAQQGRADQAIRDASSYGELDRSLQTAQEQAGMESYLRQRDVALGLQNPFGSFAVSSSPPSSVTTERRSSGGGLFK